MYLVVALYSFPFDVMLKLIACVPALLNTALIILPFSFCEIMVPLLSSQLYLAVAIGFCTVKVILSDVQK